MRIYNDVQKQEIEAVKTRTLELNLSDSDVKRISEKAGAAGVTVAELLQNFIGDLIYVLAPTLVNLSLPMENVFLGRKLIFRLIIL